MAELLVRTVDNINPDAEMDYLSSKRGDVIVVMPDGWQWSKAEAKSSIWEIVKAPGVSVFDANVFLGPEINTDDTNPQIKLRSRAVSLDLDRLPKNKKLTLKTFLALKVTKTQTKEIQCQSS